MQPLDGKITLIVGEQGSGKSYLVDELIKDYTDNGGSALVYNLGRASDFKNCVPIKFLDIEESEEYIKKKFRKIDVEIYRNKKTKPLFWKFENYIDEAGKLIKADPQIYRGEQFIEIMHGRAGKMRKIDDRLKSSLVQCFSNHFAKTLIVFDDCKGTFRNGVDKDYSELFSRVNHMGMESIYNDPEKTSDPIGYGGDLIIILHEYDQANPIFYDYLNSIISFKTVSSPKLVKVNRKALADSLLESSELLKTLPRYSYTIHPDISHRPEYYLTYKP